MKLKNINIKNLIILVVISFIYPVIKMVSSGGKLVYFIDALTIISFFYIIIGLVNSFVIHGDFDITTYYINKKNKNSMSFEKYKQSKEKERENSFNYPLFLGIIFLAICIILSKVLY